MVYTHKVNSPNLLSCTSFPGSAPTAGRSASGPGVNIKFKEVIPMFRMVLF